MKAMKPGFAAMFLLIGAVDAGAGLADSSASASSNRWGPGTATATAGYNGGGVGFAHTDTHTGKVNLAQGVSFGFDKEGVSLSSSYALAPRFGPAVGGTFNVAVGLDGSVSHSVGRTTAGGDPYRKVEVGGSARPGNRGRAPVALSTAAGKTGPRGYATAKTHSHTSRRQPKVVQRLQGRRVLRLR